MSRPFLVAVETTLPWELFDKLDLAEKKHVAKPVQVRHDEGEASYCTALQFHVVRKDDARFHLTVNVTGLEANRADLLLEASLTRTPFLWCDGSSVDRSTWRPPCPTVVTQHTASGEIGSARVTKTRCLTVRVKLFGPLPRVATTPLAQSLNEARQSGFMCDVVFVADGHEFHAHKVVVSARSAVFRSMFSSTFLEGRDGRAVIEGVSKEVFDKFLEFMYLDHISDWGDLELELLQLADRYMVDHLKDECQLRLWQVGGLRALHLLRLCVQAEAGQPQRHSADGGLAMPSPVRRRVVRIVVDNWTTIANTDEWRDFEAACPVVADVILACTASQTVDMYRTRTQFSET